MDSLLSDTLLLSLGDLAGLSPRELLLVNLIEKLYLRERVLEGENQFLRDELMRLKGGNAKPEFEKTKNGGVLEGNWSSPVEQTGVGKRKRTGCVKGSKKNKEVSRIVIHDVVPDFLPSDAKKISSLKHYQQELVVYRELVLHEIHRWYSKSEGKTYSSAPAGLISGGYGQNLQTFIQLLHHCGDMTQAKIGELLGLYEIEISCGTISDVVNRPYEWVKAERAAILAAGIASSPYTQSDSTQSKESGVSQKTHIFGSDFFSAFYSTNGKSRIDLLSALQDMPEGGIDLSFNVQSVALLEASVVSDKHLPAISEVFAQSPTVKLAEFDALLAQKDPILVEKPTVLKRIKECLALGHYWTQTDYPVIQWLLTDNAPEYRCLAQTAQALCWIHDARNYNKLMPKLPMFQQILADFLKEYWQLYQKLLAFKNATQEQQNLLKISIPQDFETLFTKKTAYEDLNQWINHTLAYQNQLLAVLTNPALPLHNNAAELAARRIVRKRDISLHTMSRKGTIVRDAFLTIIQTAHKIRINALKYIANANANIQQISLAQHINILYQ